MKAPRNLEIRANPRLGYIRSIRIGESGIRRLFHNNLPFFSLLFFFLTGLAHVRKRGVELYALLAHLGNSADSSGFDIESCNPLEEHTAVLLYYVL